MKRILILCIALVPFLGICQGETKGEALPPTVSISAKGEDVRSVLHDLFTQSKKSFVLQPSVRFVLYLSLKDIEFEEALQLVASLRPPDSWRMTSRIQRSGTAWRAAASRMWGPHGSPGGPGTG